ncbi:hypothetical protein N9I85_06045, partial [Gammaproteobacteria bacterium]|nr:hypothetical protein [Gammaproteobacteria bacterium]
MNKVFRTQDRHCQCCGSSYLEKLWTNESRNTRHSRTWIFTINIVVCKDCGFSFTSPSLHEDDLNEYHLEGFAGCK